MLLSRSLSRNSRHDIIRILEKTRTSNRKTVSASASAAASTATISTITRLKRFVNNNNGTNKNTCAYTSTAILLSAAAAVTAAVTVSSSDICMIPKVVSCDNDDIPNKISKSAQPRNVMYQRLRSVRARNLSDKYTVDWSNVIGEGAYGSVHPAKKTRTGEKVALKKICKRYTDTASFRNETDALLRIYNNGGHPNISGLRDMYEDYDHYYLLMDLVSGGEMFDHLIEFGAYSEADAARLMQEVSSALAFLHGVGIVHADLKPENLLLCSTKRKDGTMKVIDFGCSVVKSDSVIGGQFNDQNCTLNDVDAGSGSRLDTDDEDTQEIHTGTTAYWPPERFVSSKHEPDQAADMWAVGIILFIMLTGVHPFDLSGVATDEEIERHIKKNPSPPIIPELTSHLSPSAIDLIQKLFHADSKQRITAEQMLQHPWIGGEAKQEVMQESAKKLSTFKDLRCRIEAGIFSLLIQQGRNKEMMLSEYTPRMVYKDNDQHEEVGVGDGDGPSTPANSILKRAFEVIDQEGKGFLSADDLERVVNMTGQQPLSEIEKINMLAATHSNNVNNQDKSSDDSGLNLSDFSTLFAGLKHKHFQKGHTIFKAGEEGKAMYFINSGKVIIQTKKGKLVQVLRNGDFFGEGSLLEEINTRFSTAKCATPVDVIKIKKSDFQRYIDNSKSARDSLKFRWKARTLADAKSMIRLQTNVRSIVLQKGDIVYREGDMGKSMYFVDETNGGELEVKHGDDIIHNYKSGESFGESSLLLERPRSSTVTCASEKCVLHKMKGSDFLAFLENSPETKEIIQNMCRKRLFKKAVKKHSLDSKLGLTNDDLVKAFQLMDIDKSGALSFSEIKKLMHAMDPTIPESEIVQLLKFIDVDEDGKVSFDEFKLIFRQFEKSDSSEPLRNSR